MKISNSDLIKNGENGFLTEVEDVDDILEKVSHILNNQEVKEKCISGGLKDVQKYSWDKISEIYFEHIYKKLI